jgi:caffeoyl-CoA O-methyltransferase
LKGEENLAERRPEWQHHGFVTEPRVDDYLYSLLPPRDAVLAEMEEQATQRRIPIVGPVVARVLHQLALMINAKSVFEMGSAIGYSTIWWARAVGGTGRVIYTDGDRKNADEARGYFERAGVSDRITVRTGDALELLSEQKQEFDIIFNDIDKEDYPRAFRAALPRLRKGGLFITDNVLWSGKVVEKDLADATTKAIQDLNRALYSSREVFTTILPVRDGLAVAVKK